MPYMTRSPSVSALHTPHGHDRRTRFPGAHAGRRDQGRAAARGHGGAGADPRRARARVPAGAARASQGGRAGLAPQRRAAADERRPRQRCAKRLAANQDEFTRALYDFATRHVYPANNPSSAERLSLVAVGGYGRGTLAPGSDIDLLLLLPYKQTAWSESVVEWILYVLWDLGFKVGHATRRIDDTIRLARTDNTILTSLIEARFVCGDRALFDELKTASATRW
jgi:[protein-PII] uridylyltransferase